MSGDFLAPSEKAANTLYHKVCVEPWAAVALAFDDLAQRLLTRTAS
ncbi:MAG: hypothetical protein GXP26_00785 [Planctomycetes bacterium]|nr:hypothetical protein [Planctomycetota bacterium]